MRTLFPLGSSDKQKETRMISGLRRCINEIFTPLVVIYRRLGQP